MTGKKTTKKAIKKMPRYLPKITRCGECERFKFLKLGHKTPFGVWSGECMKLKIGRDVQSDACAAEMWGPNGEPKT
jgi:hypothetical protein